MSERVGRLGGCARVLCGIVRVRQSTLHALYGGECA